MTAVRKLREAINETADRWESAAMSLEVCIGSSRPAIVRRVETLRLEAVRAAGGLCDVLKNALELSPEARARTVREVDRFKDHIGVDNLEDRETVSLRREIIERSRRRLEERLERIADDVHPDFGQAVRDWVRAQMELETGLELLAERFAHEQSGDRGRFEARREEMLKSIEQFRDMLEERRFTAMRRGRPFGSEMHAAYTRIRNAFTHPAG